MAMWGTCSMSSALTLGSVNMGIFTIFLKAYLICKYFEKTEQMIKCKI